MEEYEGIVILATNLRKNMDDAFVRRMSFTGPVFFAEEQDRRHIWKISGRQKLHLQIHSIWILWLNNSVGRWQYQKYWVKCCFLGR